MNRERIKELLPVLAAYANGEDIQFHDGEDWADIEDGIEAECLDNGGLNYRIKPSEPREFWIADVEDEFRKVLLPNQKDLSAPYQYIKVREVL